MKKLNVKGPDKNSEFRMVNVHTRNLDPELPLLFTFSKFRFFPINLKDNFNNYFEDSEEYIRKTTNLLGLALPMLSNERLSIFNDLSKAKSLHIHTLDGKEEILKAIFEEYHYSEQEIDDFLEGKQIYQLEVPYENGATRVVFEKIGNLLSFLFLDPNHHIYMNRRYVESNQSLFYEFCPCYAQNMCDVMEYMESCLAFDYLDHEKYNSSFSKSYSPKKD